MIYIVGAYTLYLDVDRVIGQAGGDVYIPYLID